MLRPVIRPHCAHGVALSPPQDFQRQSAAAQGFFDWQHQHSLLLKRLRSGLTPMMLDLFCSAGGVSEGARRGGVVATGVDHVEQPSYVARFGAEAFVLSDALDLERLRALVRCVRQGPRCYPNGQHVRGVQHQARQLRHAD